MGRTSFSGPVYGAKGNLISCYYATVPMNATTELCEVLVPSGEDWYITDLHAFCTHQGNAGDIDIESPNGTSLLASDLALSANAGVNKTLVADGGEDEGKRVASGARIHIEADVGATTSATGVMINVLGYVRKLNTPL